MIEGERLDPLPLVTDEVSLDELPARFEALKAPSEDCKVLIRPGT
jgi:threonine dehydrogenase-like Zn-dependent dehydrogenase